jgi:hypothetical protein
VSHNTFDTTNKNAEMIWAHLLINWAAYHEWWNLNLFLKFLWFYLCFDCSWSKSCNKFTNKTGLQYLLNLPNFSLGSLLLLSCFFCLFVCLFVLVLLGFEFRASCLLYHLSYTPKPFCAFVIAQAGSCIFAWDWPQTMMLLSTISPIAGITGPCHYAQLIVNFLPGITWNHNPSNLCLPNS